ncbi:MAG: hypothetical protein P4L46_22755 [Fimbriimonas sp.]|nr:hypothetical protein [Fimbriimonas sp.]
MPNSRLDRTIAVGAMSWSVVAGAAGLVAIRMLQVIAGSGHVEPFPGEIVAYYVGGETVLLVVLLGILRRQYWAAPALSVMLATVVLSTVLFLRTGAWALDFLQIALCIEAVWLGPWLIVGWRLWRTPD